jgi:hypothetical protein
VGKTIGDTRRTTVNQNVEDEAAGAAARATYDEGTLHGTYLLAYDGVVTGGADKGPFAVAECDWFDGKGNIEGVSSANYSRNITSKQKFTGTYTVNANCAGTATYPSGEVYDLFIAPDGCRFTFVQIYPPSMWRRGFLSEWHANESESEPLSAGGLLPKSSGIISVLCISGYEPSTLYIRPSAI